MKKEPNKDARDSGENIDEGDVEFYNDEAQNRFASEAEEGFDQRPEDTIKALKKKLKESEREKIENLTGWQRAKADYINLKKRGSEANEQIRRQAKESVLQSFFPVFDSFEIAMKGEAWQHADPKWRAGVESIYKQFLSALSSEGVESVGEVGEAFDPYVHTSVSTIPTDDKEKDHTVAEVLQKGFKLSTGEVIRSPKVVVFEHNA